MLWSSYIVRSWNTNGIMVWARMLWSSYALGTGTLLCFENGCSGHRISYVLGTRTELWLGHGCSGPRMLLEHERNYGVGMDALVIVCSWNTNGIMVWAWMLWSSYALREATWQQQVSPAHRPWSLTSCKGTLLEPPNAGSTRLRPTKNMMDTMSK